MGSVTKVRIALVVNGDGEYNAIGWSSGLADNDMMLAALDGLQGTPGACEKQYWVDLEVEIPVAEVRLVEAALTAA